MDLTLRSQREQTPTVLPSTGCQTVNSAVPNVRRLCLGSLGSEQTSRLDKSAFLSKEQIYSAKYELLSEEHSQQKCTFTLYIALRREHKSIQRKMNRWC